MIPLVAPVRQQVISDSIEDVSGLVRRGLRSLPLADRVRPGMRVAVALGSRGISCLPEIARVLLGELLALRAEPFLVPAMGSHGGGTAEGQQTVIEDYGLGAGVLGIPILSSMETVRIGETPEGMPVYFDVNAAGADGIIVINRIKQHTAFRGKWESGLLKMLAVGLGKADGAAEIHNRSISEAMPAAARLVLSRMPVLFGMGIVEDGKGEPARIAVIPAERIEQEEPALLDLAQRLAPKIPFDPLDLLVIQQMGKDISGTGMDLNVIGMWRRTGGAVEPKIGAIGVLDLTENSHGNATGVGHADLITRRLFDKIDFQSTYRNCLTAHNLAGAKIPITLPTDRAVVEAGVKGLDPRSCRVVLIRNTSMLELLWVSEPLLDYVTSTPTLEQIGPARPLAFDESDNLISPQVI
jgi:hypothetical protein